jgi:hypothetical protein
MAAEGFRRLLGRPALGLLQTLVREAVQNVLDASTGPAGPTIVFRVRTLSLAEATCLRDDVLTDLPPGDSTLRDVEASLSKRHIRVIEICDFGTQGLSGPTRADAPDDGREPLNFVNFLRNVGARRDTHQGGGTYGYGKSSLYAMSGCSTVIVDTQTTCGSQDERRFMACHLGAAFDAVIGEGVGRRFTGRHWWGIPDEEDSIEPSTGEHAATLAAQLGMLPRGIDRRGTSILIVDPILSGESLAEVAEDIVEAVLWNFWPRMVESTPAARRLTVRIGVNDAELTVPRPEEFPPLDIFATAMAEFRRADGARRSIVCGRPKRNLGHVVIKKALRANRVGISQREGSLIPGHARHIALMRPVELVVKYIEGEPLPDSRFEWGGVFVCSDDAEVEEAFAMAEPPAHDDWIPDNLPKGNEKTYVKVALRELTEISREHTSISSTASGESAATPSLAETASKLGALLGVTSTTGPGKRPSQRTSSPSKSPLGVSIPYFVNLEMGANGRPLARFRATVRNEASVPNLRLVAEPHLVADGSVLDGGDLPEGHELYIETISMEGRHSGAGEHTLLLGDEVGLVDILVSITSSAASGVKLRLLQGDES